jgi:hypothetical protein
VLGAALAVVVGHIGGEHVFEVAAAEDQQPVETLVSNGANEPLRVGVGLWRPDRCSDDLDPFALEDVVEGGAELAVAVVNQEPRPFEDTREAEVARLLGDPAAARVRRAAGEVSAAVSEFEEEEHVVAAERERLDGEEVTGERAPGLLAEELPPTWPRAPRGRFKSRGQKQPPNRAWRDTEAQFQQLAGDPWVAPARILPCQAQIPVPAREAPRAVALNAAPAASSGAVPARGANAGASAA